MNGKKLVRGTVLAALCMAAMLYANSTVSMAFWVAVISDNTRVRNAASIESEVMTAVNAGDKLSVVSEEQDSEGNKWYKVSINNVSGYVRADTVEETSEPGTEPAAAVTEQPTAAEQPQESTAQPVEASSSASVTAMATQAATVKSDNVNVRSTASTNGSVVAKLQNGAAVTLTGTLADSSGKTWYQVNFINNGSNVTGFIREDFVEPGEIMEPQAPAEETPGGEGDAGIADAYGDMPAEGETANNDYELFFEADSEGVDCWYIHDNIAQKRYKLEQLMQADEMNTSNLAIKNEEIRRLKIVLIVLAALLVLALAAAAIFGFKYHDLKDEEDEDEDEDEDDDFREAPPVRRRERTEAGSAVRRSEAVRSEGRSTREAVRRTDGSVQRRPAANSQRRPEEESARTRSAQPGRARTEAQRKPLSDAPRTRSAQPAPQARRTQTSTGSEAVRRTGRSDVEWRSKNFLAGDEDELDFSFINGEDEE